MSFPFSFSGTIPFKVEREGKLKDALIEALTENGATVIDSSDDEIRFRGITAYLTDKPLVNIERGTVSIHEELPFGEVRYRIDYERWTLLGAFILPAFGILVWLASTSWIFLAFGLVAGLFLFLNFFWVQFRFSRWLARTVDHDLTS